MQGMDEIAALLHIYEKASAHGGQLGHIATTALAELIKLNAAMEAKSDPPEHSMPGEPPREPPPQGETPPSDEPEAEAEEPHSVGSVTVGGSNG